jgi:hemerythrin
MTPEPVQEVVWTEAFSVANRHVDEQHKALVAMLNRLLRHPNATVDSEVVSATLGAMIEYARGHFRDEERLMAEAGYPDLAAHRAQHVAFLERAVEFCDATTGHVETVPRELLAYLRQWLLDHILREDTKCRAYFARLPRA